MQTILNLSIKQPKISPSLEAAGIDSRGSA